MLETQVPSPFSATVPLTTYTDRRRAGRHLVRWRARIYTADGWVCEGVTRDLSEAGTAIFVDHNLRCGRSPVQLQLAIPAAAGAPSVRLVKAEARQVYSILDSKEKQFRVAFEFLDFAHGKEAMLLRLALSGSDVSHL